MASMPMILVAILGLKAVALLAVLWETTAARQEQCEYSMSGRRGPLKIEGESGRQDEADSARFPRRRVTAAS